jgi:hypothetical protein
VARDPTARGPHGWPRAARQCPEYLNRPRQPRSETIRSARKDPVT